MTPPRTATIRVSRGILVALLGAVVACGGPAEAPPEGEAMAPEAPAPDASVIVAPDAVVELVQDGYAFTEGPVAGPDGSLYFSDIPANHIHRLRPDGTVELFREETNGANGLAIDDEGRIIAVEGGSGRVVAIDAEGNLEVLVEPSDEGPGRPNDLILDGRGGQYITDPAPRPEAGAAPSRPSRVFYLSPAGDLVLLTDQIERPNGITLTLDGQTLVIANSAGTELLAMSVQPNGTATGLRTWGQLRGIPAGETSAADGLAIDADGRVYVATRVGVQVLNPEGEHLETIETPKQPSNIAFGGPNRELLYITAREGLYRVPLLTRGPADRFK